MILIVFDETTAFTPKSKWHPPKGHACLEVFLSRELLFKSRTATAIYGGVDISKVPGCHLLRQMSSQ